MIAGLLAIPGVKTGLLGLLAVGLIFGAVKYIERRQAEVTTLQIKHTEAVAVAEMARAHLLTVQEGLKREQKLREEADKALAKERQLAAERMAIFNRHRLGELLQEKPGMIEKRINAATTKVWQEIEAESQ